MSNTNTVETVEMATCAVCFGEFALQVGKNAGKPARHGFNVHGAGQVGAWHTGACQGWRFPHYGLSNEGTIWAVGHVTAQLARAVEFKAKLATKPTLNWFKTPSRYDLAHNKITSKDLNPGDQYDSINGIPSYDDMLAREVAANESQISNLEHGLKFLQGKRDSWTPAATKTVAKKPPTVHLQSKRNTWAPACTLSFRGNANYRTTTDHSKVNCERCKKYI